MMACTPNSDSCSCKEGDGVTLLWPTAPIKCPIKLVAGFSNRAFPLAPPKVWLCVDCSACAWGAGLAAGIAAEDPTLDEDDSAFTVAGADINTSRASDPSPGALVSAKTFS